MSYLIAGFLGSLVLVFFVIRTSISFRLMAVPNKRSFHHMPTPTAGGLGFVIPVLGFVALMASDGIVLAQGFLAAGVLLAAVSLWDDYREIRSVIRFVCQLVAVMIVVWSLQLTWHWTVIGIVGLGMVWHINLFNFMDGIDGIAGVQCLLYCLGAHVLTLGVGGWTGNLMWLLMGTVLAFLVYNWPSAKIFMGDVGSAFLGLLLGLLVVELWHSERLSLIASAILLAGFWFDATYTLCVRMLTGQAYTQAHRSHLYQQIANDKGHLRTTGGFLLYGVCWLIPLAWLALHYRWVEYLMLGIALAPLAVLAVRFQAGLRRNLMDESELE